MAKRRTRDEIVRDNREALLRAAQEMFERLGYHRASVDAIAEAAGLSKGAVYSQFGSKDELILAVIERNAAVRRDALARGPQSAGEDAEDAEDAEELIRLALEQTSSSLAWQAAVIEFRVHAWRDEALSRRYAKLHRRTIEGLTQLFEELGERAATDPGRSPTQLAAVSVVVSAGLVVELLADPTLDIEPAVDAIAAVVGHRLTSADTR